MARIKKRMLWRDILATFKKSRGRFLSIACLIALGSFALVGLKVAGPDMRETSASYFAPMTWPTSPSSAAWASTRMMPRI